MKMSDIELMDLMKRAIEESKKISSWDRDGRWYAREGVNWKESCMLKDRAIALYDVRWQLATEAIDLIAEELGVADLGRYLYTAGTDDRHFIVETVRDYLSRGGNKAGMKKRIAELENENAVLRSLVGKP